MGRPGVLRLTSCQAENSEFIGRAVTRYLGERLGMRAEFVDDVPWEERERLLDRGVIHAGWICGLPYVLKTACSRPAVELLAAPVMAGARYARRPVYFSDIVVHRDSHARSFADLRGGSWAYNEPGSHSGHNIVRFHLAQIGEGAGYFARITETGAHQKTLRMIEDGSVEASAIDSTVLETELRRRPALARSLRVIETWGPSPAPPWVASRRLPPGLRRELRSILVSMHREPAGRAVLREARMARFDGVTDRDYESIRRMTRAAGGVLLQKTRHASRTERAGT